MSTETVSVTMRLSRDTVGRVDALASSSEVSRTAMVEELLRRGLGSTARVPVGPGQVPEVAALPQGAKVRSSSSAKAGVKPIKQRGG